MSYQWRIALLIACAITISYFDRQTVPVAIAAIQRDIPISNTQFAQLQAAFLIAYALMYAGGGRLLDALGTRRGFAFIMVWWSLACAAHGLANGFAALVVFRLLLGIGEGGGFPAATKAVSEWFPKQERALATAFFDSGSSVGGAIAPFIVLFIYFHWGWRPAIAIPGVLGFLWILVWRKIYHPPESHPLISDAERNMLAQDKSDLATTSGSRPRWRDLLKFPQTWGTIVARSFTDPVWYFVTDWFPIYLVAKGLELFVRTQRGCGLPRAASERCVP